MVWFPLSATMARESVDKAAYRGAVVSSVRAAVAQAHGARAPKEADMAIAIPKTSIKSLVDGLDFAQKVARSSALIREAYEEYGDRLVVANSLGKDSCAVWHLAKRVAPEIRGFVVTTRYKPKETIAFMNETLASHPELQVYRSDSEIGDKLYETAPDSCCDALKVEPTRRAIQEMNVGCWVTGLRCTEGRTRTDFQELEERDAGLLKLNPILIWQEREVWQYLSIYRVPVNPLYAQGYRSLGCAPCTRISTGPDERAGRWLGTSKCGGECGIHTRALLGQGA
jgi:phosphoadenosine phosphosulfate reductase